MLEEAQTVLQEQSLAPLADMSAGHWQQRCAVTDPYAAAVVDRSQMQDGPAARPMARERRTSQQPGAADSPLSDEPLRYQLQLRQRQHSAFHSDNHSMRRAQRRWSKQEEARS